MYSFVQCVTSMKDGFLICIFLCYLTLHLCPLSCLLSFRDQNDVLAEDREKLRVLQPLQPWFTQEQREELAEVHPWIKQHTIPQEIDTQVGSCNHTHSFKCIHLPACLRKGLMHFCLTGLCKLLRRCRGRPLPSSSWPWQLFLPGEPTAGPHWTSDGHLTDLKAKTTIHPAHSKPALPETLTTPNMHFFWPIWRSGSLCFILKLNMFCKGISGWTWLLGNKGGQSFGHFYLFSLSQPNVTAFIGP